MSGTRTDEEIATPAGELRAQLTESGSVVIWIFRSRSAVVQTLVARSNGGVPSQFVRYAGCHAHYSFTKNYQTRYQRLRTVNGKIQQARRQGNDKVVT